MFARLTQPRKAAARLLALFSMLWLAACQPMVATGPVSEAQRVTPGAPVKVALLVPAGSSSGADQLLARNLENAARLAIADLGDVEIDMTVYPTAGEPSRAAQAATTAVAEGAQVILGPLYAEAANAAGVAAASQGVNVLAFSNNPTIAGGNVFILGPTFANTADRLVQYGMRNGIQRYVVAYGNDLQGAVGRDAIVNAVNRSGGAVAGTEAYELSQAGVQSAAPRVADTVRGTGATGVFTTAGVNADLPILATALNEAGITPQQARMMGLTRWDAAPQALALPGLQNGIFAVPDTGRSNAFEQRYAASYGADPHPLAGLAYDGIAAIGALAASGRADALTRNALVQSQGFKGTSGIFRLLSNGTNQRGLAVATIRNNQVVILDPAPTSFGRAGF
ncbi:penicillin-binding protein activator [Limimaricola hongkongensis]|uniref:ABC-type branched-chain amino acid transport system, periplasmic component n=1 Tax=Limimaricola hongkongensis DSM 17492 TaxID=1122180 RepID=A0A017H8R1_9RHOB|nr:penicillin-binding protein activator [Limimaricola hongkongensis]EYD70695.1 ABC-type branched-chain amino acid transport system, periplasmic component [Limimaricola hongkongensis DSM 17492]